MPLFRFEGALRYTRWSCRPFAARWPIDRVVQARDRADALRQVGLCVHRDLEEILSQVNAINVGEVRVETVRLEALAAGDDAEPWNPTPFPEAETVPRHIELCGV